MPHLLLDVRLVLDRRDRVRVRADGRRVLEAAAIAGALRTLAARVDGQADELGALAAMEGEP